MPPTEPQQVNTVWAEAATHSGPTFLTLPSGQTCWAIPIGLAGVIESGVLGEADSLTAFVGSQYLRKVRGANGRADTTEIDPHKLAANPGVMGKVIKLVNQVTPMVVKQPEVRCHFTLDDKGESVRVPDDKRKPGVIYTDVIGIEDQMFLFNFAMGGMRDAAKFREGAAAAVATVEDGEGISHDPQSTTPPRAKRKRPPRRRT